jgi:hypothetical protein
MIGGRESRKDVKEGDTSIIPARILLFVFPHICRDSFSNSKGSAGQAE